MQIHELNNYAGGLDSGAYIAVDDGSDTGKVSVSGLLADTAADISELDNFLNARIDNIIAGGTAPSASEIVDARLGADGVAYPSLGDAIRDQVSDLKSDFNDISDLNVTWTEGKYIWKDGGVEVSGASYKITDYIPISNIRVPIKYKMRVFNNCATYALYDSNKAYISDSARVVSSSSLIADEGTLILTTANAAYVRFSTEKSDWFGSYVKMGNLNNLAIGNATIDSEKIASKAVNLSNVGETIITHDEQTNFVDLAKVKSGFYIDSTGAEHSTTGYNVTDFIPLEDGKTYYEREILYTYFAFYDSDKNLIESYDTYGNLTNFWFIPPTGTAYGRFTMNDTQLASGPWISINDAKPSPYKLKINNDNINSYAVPNGSSVENPCDYEGKDIAVFNKICCIGDSITIGTFNHNEGGTEQYLVDTKYSYPTFLKKMYGVDTENWGLGGYTSVQWWNAKQNEDFSGFDCAIINLGINDALNSVSISDTETAFRSIINALKTANNNIKIFLATIVPAYADGVTTFDAVNELIEDLAEELTNCYLVDLSQYSHVSKGSAYEAGHLTAIGYRMLAQDYAGYIGYIIRTDLTGFKWVQFIGTNYSRT